MWRCTHHALVALGFFSLPAHALLTHGLRCHGIEVKHLLCRVAAVLHVDCTAVLVLEVARIAIDRLLAQHERADLDQAFLSADDGLHGLAVIEVAAALGIVADLRIFFAAKRIKRHFHGIFIRNWLVSASHGCKR